MKSSIKILMAFLLVLIISCEIPEFKVPVNDNGPVISSVIADGDINGERVKRRVVEGVEMDEEEGRVRKLMARRGGECGRMGDGL